MKVKSIKLLEGYHLTTDDRKKIKALIQCGNLDEFYHFGKPHLLHKVSHDLDKNYIVKILEYPNNPRKKICRTHKIEVTFEKEKEKSLTFF